MATTDFFTPIVDDPFDFGTIAAANCLSDIYAMGGSPFMALNIAALPPQLPTEIASEILRGGALKAKEAGVVIAGGHTIQDKEPKYGLIALGFVALDRVLTKSGMQVGDTLFLSKPIGSGVIASGIKKKIIRPDEEREVIDWMKRLNKDVSELALLHGARAATDITGFSLLGHAWEMAEASGTELRFDFEAIPLYRDTQRLAKEWCFAGGAFDNKDFFERHISFPGKLLDEEKMTLFDPQTSGGLLFAISPENSTACMSDAQQKQIPLWEVGVVTGSGKIEIR